MWSNQENRVRKKMLRHAQLVTFTQSSQKISTHHLTVLIMYAIVQIEQRKRDKESKI